MEPGKEKLKITEDLFISTDELIFTPSRSSGPGGQNVNKVNTRVTLWFDILQSPSLSQEEKQQILQKFPTRINKSGLLWVNAQQTRSQTANRESAKTRLIELLREALIKPIPRKKTRIPYKKKEERMEGKKRRGQLKATRSSKISWEG